MVVCLIIIPQLGVAFPLLFLLAPNRTPQSIRRQPKRSANRPFDRAVGKAPIASYRPRFGVRPATETAKLIPARAALRSQTPSLTINWVWPVTPPVAKSRRRLVRPPRLAPPGQVLFCKSLGIRAAAWPDRKSSPVTCIPRLHLIFPLPCRSRRTKHPRRDRFVPIRTVNFLLLLRDIPAAQHIAILSCEPPRIGLPRPPRCPFFVLSLRDSCAIYR